MTKYLLLSLVAFLPVLLAKAQPMDGGADVQTFEHRFSIGYNIGGLSPVSFPATIRQVKSYSPGFAPSLGYEFTYQLNQTWSIGTGIRADLKRMNVTDKVQYFHTLVSIDDASIEGDFTGTNNTIVKNIYVSLPLHIIYRNQSNWRFKLGGYVARLVRPSFYGSVSDGYLRKGNSLGEKVIIDYATFNFDNNERQFDFGLSGGVDKVIYKNFAISADLQWGLRPVFPDTFNGISFNMYNIFATLGLNYKLAI